MQNWYALNSKPHSEKQVCEILAARGIASYLPLWYPAPSRGRVARARPFFPSYLFAHADLELIGLSALQYLPGVRRVVFSGDEPARVAPAVIEDIRRRLTALENTPTDAEGAWLVPGDRVLITGGPFEGWGAIFDRRLSSGDRVRLLINFLQKNTPLEIEREFVRKNILPRRNLGSPRTLP